jgi:ferredoxin
LYASGIKTPLWINCRSPLEGIAFTLPFNPAYHISHPKGVRYTLQSVRLITPEEREGELKGVVERDKCSGFGSCVIVAPDVFRLMNDQAKAVSAAQNWTYSTSLKERISKTR